MRMVWGGGACPCPDDRVLRVWLRDGAIEICEAAQLAPVRWTHQGGAQDIVAYEELVPASTTVRILLAENERLRRAVMLAACYVDQHCSEADRERWDSLIGSVPALPDGIGLAARMV